MELNILEDTPKRLVMEVKGESHTLCNALKTALWANKHVKSATYAIAHPLVGIPKMVVETDGEVKPKKALAEAADRLLKETEKLKKDLSKIK